VTLEPAIPALPVRRVQATDFGTRELAAVDLDNNLLEFFVWDA
jgi:hypothetical protein